MKSIVITGAIVLLGGTLCAQETQNQFLDVLYLHVKPGKGAEFSTIARKIADANRHYKGSDWLCFESQFGPGGTYMMTSSRKDFAAVDLSWKMFQRALGEAFTPTGATKLLEEAGNLLTSSWAELHRRRPDLSFNAPSDASELAKLVGEARWAEISTVRVRPGRTPEMEDAIRTVKEYSEAKAEPKFTTLVSQSALGSNGVEYYFTDLRKSLGDYDRTASPKFKEALGEEAFRKFENSVAEIASASSSAMYRIVSEFSSPPAAIAAADTAFWNPKPMATAARRTMHIQPRTDTPAAATAPKK